MHQSNLSSSNGLRDGSIVFFFSPLAVLTTFVIFERVAPGCSTRFAGWPLVISLVLVGMPHGAADLAVNNRLAKAISARRQIARFAGYLLMLTASLALFVASPSLALLLFITVSALHFGLADARDLDFFHRHKSPVRLLRFAALARGFLVLGLPFAVSPVESMATFADITNLAGRPLPPLDPLALQQLASLVVLAASSTLVIVVATRTYLRQVGLAFSELLETSVLAVAFLTLHPLFAIGLYVLTWHSWRHLHRLALFFGRSPGRHGWVSDIVRLHVQSLPLLLPTIAIFLAIAWLRLEAWTSTSLAALTIAIFTVVTLPHHLLVERVVRHSSPSRTGLHAAWFHPKIHPNPKWNDGSAHRVSTATFSS